MTQATSVLQTSSAQQPSPTIEPTPCPHCYGTGTEVVSGKGARRCEYCRKKDPMAMLKAARIPERFMECALQNYERDKRNKSQLSAVQAVSRILDAAGRVEKGLLLVGPTGVGKTHLAVSIIKGLVEQGVPCLFRELGPLLADIRSSYEPDSRASELALLAPVCNAKVLVLDELGTTKLSDWARDILQLIVCARHDDKRLTIFTTNYADGPTSFSEKTLEDRIGIRCRSRIHAMCDTLVITGADHRRRLDELSDGSLLLPARGAMPA